jgi:hypothetical protein
MCVLLFFIILHTLFVLYLWITASKIAECAFIPHDISHTDTPTRQPNSSGLPVSEASPLSA